MDDNKKPGKPSRDHHFVPRFLLKNFTTDDGQLCVTDLRTGRQRWSSVSGTAYQPHFNSIEVPGYSSDVVENFLSKIETQAAPIIQEICESHYFPLEVKDRAALMLFVAFQATRVPKRRTEINNFVDQIIRSVASIYAEVNKEQWATVREQAAANGFQDFPSYGDFKKVIADKEIRFSLTQNVQVKTMIDLAKELAPLLAMRRWSVAISNSGSFITSDTPIFLRNTIPLPGYWASPGFALSQTEVFFPLSRYVALRGRFETIQEQLSLNRKAVCSWNSMTISNAYRFIYSPTHNFHWMTHDHRTVDGVAEFRNEAFAKRPSAP